MRLHAIAGNIANISTTRNEAGESKAYQPRYAVFQTDDDVGTRYGASGVKVASIETETADPLWKYQPTHPDAVRSGPKTGYVAYPNINMINEFVDATEATRSYEANVAVVEMTKSLGQQTLRILG